MTTILAYLAISAALLAVLAYVQRPEEPETPRDPTEREFRLKPGYEFNPLLNWPRNKNCFCGSLRKAKNCCQARVPKAVPKAKAEVLRRYLALVRAQGADAVRVNGKVTLVPEQQRRRES